MPKAGTQAEGGDSKGGVNYSEKVLEPTNFMVYTEFNPRKLERLWRRFQPEGNLVFRDLPDEGKIPILKEIMKQVGKEMGWHMINGKKGTTDDELFNGILVAINGDPDTIQAGSSAVSMLGKLYALRSNIPDELTQDPNLRILMNTSDFQRYDDELTAQIAKGVNHTDVSPRRFKGFDIEDLTNWPRGLIVATLCSNGTDGNLYAACNLQNDAECLLIDKVTASGERYFIKILLTMDTNIAWGQECVKLIKVAPAITADKTDLIFPMEGGEETVKLKVTEQYIVESIPDGLVVTEDEDGILVSADDNTSDPDIEDKIVLALKEHRSRKLRINVMQPGGNNPDPDGGE